MTEPTDAAALRRFSYDPETGVLLSKSKKVAVGRPHKNRYPVETHLTTRHCDDCGHTGDEGGSTTESYCGSCGATVPYPKEDKCHECGATNCMLIACPKCGGRYWDHEQQEEA